MTQTDALQQALMRFDASVDNLERFLGQLADDRDAVAKLKEQLRSLTDERNRLAAELDVERGRARRLEAANDEVSGRLEAVMGTLRDIAPAKGFEL
jgi:ABC-type transporter Mla subunit MlaD